MGNKSSKAKHKPKEGKRDKKKNPRQNNISNGITIEDQSISVGPSQDDKGRLVCSKKLSLS